MNKIDPNKVFTQYRDTVTPSSPVKGRKYTMTHSDVTADLFVAIGLNYAEDLVSSMRDEVRLRWTMINYKVTLYGEVIIDGEDIPGNPFIRNKIFTKEMPTALQAVRYGDRFLFDKYPELDSANIIVKFNSTHPIYNKTYNFGIVEQYII